MRFELFIGRRYLRARRKQAFISLITILSTAGVAVGVMALIVVIAVMAGAQSEFRSRILGVQSHAVLMRYGGEFAEYPQIIRLLEQEDNVVASRPFILTQVMLRSPSGISGAVLKGVAPRPRSNATSRALVMPWRSYTLTAGNLPTRAAPPLWYWERSWDANWAWFAAIRCT